MSLKIVKAFEKEVNLTEEGLAELVKNKASLVIEFNTKSGMTLARKERTERNKLIEEVKRKSIDTENSIKVRRKEIIKEINEAYNCIVEPFEAEELRLKQEKEKTEKIEEERKRGIRDEINSIRNFSLNLFGKSSQELSDIIESVDLIDVEISFAEFTQEAMQVKKETLTELNLTLSSVIQKEQLEEDRKKLQIQQKAQELKNKAQERLNNLVMIPSTMFGKSSKELNKKQNSLDLYEVNEDEFGELFDQANASKLTVIQQLGVMAEQQLIVENAQSATEVKEKPKTSLGEVLNEGETLGHVVEKSAARLSNTIFEDKEVFKQSPEVNDDKSQIVKTNKVHGGFTTAIELTPHEQQLAKVEHWANDYGIHGTIYSDLINILNQYQ